MSSAEVVVASTALYMVLNAFFYWTVVKTTVLSQRIMARESTQPDLPSSRVLREEELEWLAYVGVQVQLPLAVAVAMLELVRVTDTETRLPLLYAGLLVLLTVGTGVICAVRWSKLRSHNATLQPDEPG